jgi:hypothetical protein
VIHKGPVFTRHIGFRVREETFSRVEELADLDGKFVNEWCRDKLLKAIDHDPANSAVPTLLAEIAASREINISLMFAFARDGRLAEQKVREIISQSEKHKHEYAARLLEQAQAAQKSRNKMSTEGNIS